MDKNREDFWFKTNIVLNIFLVILLGIALIAHFIFSLPYDQTIFIILAMVGDGVNDATALALVDVSIAMGIGGSDATIEAADITLIKNNLEKIPEVILLGRATMEIIKQNFWLWGILNALGLSLVFAGFLNPVGAAAFNFATDFVPILNALRVGVVKLKK